MERVRYICPICDHELVAGGFCPSCKKIIKEPVKYKGGYLPNEDTGSYILNKKVSEHADYGSCGGHKESDYGMPNVDPHTPKKKSNKAVLKIFWWMIFIYIVYIIIRIFR